MLYDRLAKSVERNADVSPLFQIVSHARLFTFYRDYATIPVIERGSVDPSGMTFFLPFQTVALEDRQRVVILHDAASEVQGIDQPRRFVVLLNLRELAAYGIKQCQQEATAFQKELANVPDFDVIAEGKMSGGKFSFSDSGVSIRFNCSLWNTWSLNRQTEITQLLPEAFVMQRHDGHSLADTLGTMVLSAFSEVGSINTPSRFILESAPSIIRQPEPGRILRAHERANYTILEPERIRKVMRLPLSAEKGLAKRPHERRSHLRRLHSERFTHKRGEFIVIPATWIGPSESVIGGRRYRVILD